MLGMNQFLFLPLNVFNQLLWACSTCLTHYTHILRCTLLSLLLKNTLHLHHHNLTSLLHSFNAVNNGLEPPLVKLCIVLVNSVKSMFDQTYGGYIQLCALLRSDRVQKSQFRTPRFGFHVELKKTKYLFLCHHFLPDCSRCTCVDALILPAALVSFSVMWALHPDHINMPLQQVFTTNILITWTYTTAACIQYKQ